uniref:HNH domain-containing protein n=1 Tax=viral metagenome TaxID=1070528 RepID=A0A6C0HFY3_9ZZZZ
MNITYPEEIEYKKRKIPKCLREALWIYHNPSLFTSKCKTTWCPNKINAFNFQAGHNVPESKGGITSLENLVPICARCNLSMGNRYTFIEWCKFTNKEQILEKKSWFSCIFSKQSVTLPSQKEPNQ